MSRPPRTLVLPSIDARPTRWLRARVALGLSAVALGSSACGARGGDRPSRFPGPSSLEAVTGAPATGDATTQGALGIAGASVAAVAEPPSGSAAFRSRLESAAASLARRTSVPFRAPLVFLGTPKDDVTDDSVFVTIRTADVDGYDVVLGTENCSGATACRAGRLTGRRITPDLPRPEGTRVKLAGIGRAVFARSVCGANCSDAVLTWDQDRVRYTVGLKAGDLDDFRPMAKSIVRLP